MCEITSTQSLTCGGEVLSLNAGEICRKCISWSIVFYLWCRSFKTCFVLLNVSFTLETKVTVGSKQAVPFCSMNF